MLAGEGMLMSPVGTLNIHLEEVLPLIQHLVAPSRSGLCILNFMSIRPTNTNIMVTVCQMPFYS